jgi:hypothetical protein
MRKQIQFSDVEERSFYFYNSDILSKLSKVYKLELSEDQVKSLCRGINYTSTLVENHEGNFYLVQFSDEYLKKNGIGTRSTDCCYYQTDDESSTNYIDPKSEWSDYVKEYLKYEDFGYNELISKSISEHNQIWFISSNTMRKLKFNKEFKLDE